MEPSSDRLMWGLIGCAALLVTGLCLATGLGAYWIFSSSPSGPVATPTPVGPGTPPYPQQPQPFPQQPQPFPQQPQNPALPPPPLPAFRPLGVSARVESVTGSRPVAPGATCSFDVERHALEQPGTYWCRAQMQCGGVLLYGGGQSGYFPCTLLEPRGVFGEDVQTTAEDTDASMQLDTRTGVLTLRDDATGPHGAFDLRARIESVQ